MFKNGIDLKALGVWNLVITVIVLLVRLLDNSETAYQGQLWFMPLLTLGLGLLLIYKATNRFEKGSTALRTRLLLFVGAIAFVSVKYMPADTDNWLYSYIAASAMLLVGLGWYFVRWTIRKSVLI